MLQLLHDPRDDASALDTTVELSRGLRLLVNTANDFERQAFLYGFEPEVRTILRRFIRPGRTAIDVGANVGAHTLVMAQAVQDGRVIACEPNPAICVRLSANLALNHLTNVSLHQVAVCGCAEPSLHPHVLFVPTDSRRGQACASLQHHDRYLGEAKPTAVWGTTLDSLVGTNGVEAVDLIKIDVEGLEGAVPQGGRNLLLRDRPTLVFEYTRDWWATAGYTLEAILSDLRALGYVTILNLTRRGLDRLPLPAPDFMNVFASA